MFTDYNVLITVSIPFLIVAGYFAGAKLVTKMYKKEMLSLQKKSYILPIYTFLAFFFVDKQTKKTYIETPGKMVSVGKVLAELPATAKRNERKEKIKVALPLLYN